MTGPAELMIGEFARRSRLPVSTLRYYDRIGLLAPASVDPDSGYRRYSVEQLPAAMLIHRLRSLGLAPAGIARVLADGPAALLRERRRIADDVEAGRERLRRLDELLAERTQDDHRAEVVTLRQREVAARAFLLPAAELGAGVTRAIAALRSALRRAGHRRTGPWGATFPVDPADRVSGFVFAPVDADDPADIDTARLPASTAVATVHDGSPASLPLAYHAAFALLDRLGAEPTGLVIEEYPTLEGAAGVPPSVRVWVPFARHRGVPDLALRCCHLELFVRAATLAAGNTRRPGHGRIPDGLRDFRSRRRDAPERGDTQGREARLQDLR